MDLKKRLRESGFIWGPETHSYGVNGFYVYGPAGKQLKLKIESIFRNIFEQNNFFEIETPVLSASRAWVASGHLKRFNKEMFLTKTSDGVNMCGRSEMATTIYSLLKLFQTQFINQSPIKIYQTGVVLPNDIQTEYQIRTRQYTAHEGHLIFTKNKLKFSKIIKTLNHLAFELMTSIAIPRELLIFREKMGNNKPFYATKAYGMYIKLPNQPELELLGVQYRSDYDFKQHSLATNTKLTIDNQYPHDFEISFSSDRPLYVITQILLSESGDRKYLNFPVNIAPYLYGVLPVDNNRISLKLTNKIARILTKIAGPTPILLSGKVSSRYKQSDLIGIPKLIIVDKSNTLYIRDRNTGIQTNVSLADIEKLKC